MKFECRPITVNNLFKFQVHDNNLEYLFWQCEKYIALPEKKPPPLLGTKFAKPTETENIFVLQYLQWTFLGTGCLTLKRFF